MMSILTLFVRVRPKGIYFNTGKGIKSVTYNIKELYSVNRSFIRLFSNDMDKFNISRIENLKLKREYVKGNIINLILKALEQSSSLKVVKNEGGVDFDKLALEIYNILLFLGWYKNVLLKREFNIINKVFKNRVRELTRSDEIVLELEKIYLENVSKEYDFYLDKVYLSDLKLEKEVFHKFVEKIEIFCKKREVDFKDFDFTDLYKLYMYILLNEDENLLNYFVSNLDKLCENLVRITSDGLYRNKMTRKGKHKQNEYGTVAYTNYVKKLIELNIIEINKEICNMFTQCDILKLTSEFESVLNRLNKKYSEIIKKLFDESIFYTLETKGMRVVKNLKEKNVTEFSQYQNSIIDHIASYTSNLNIIKDTTLEEDPSLIYRRLKFEEEASLFKMIKSVLDNSELDLREKQLLIEKGLLEYEITYFEELLKGRNTLGNIIFNKDNEVKEGKIKSISDRRPQNLELEFVILHECYMEMKTGLTRLVKEYKVNKYRKLKNELKKNSSKGRLMLILLSVDIDKSINFIFKNTLDLMRSSFSKEGYVLETPLIIELAERYLRFVKNFSNSEIIKIYNDCNIDKINSKESFYFLDLKDLANLGETLLELMLENGKMFEREYVRKPDNIQVFIKTKESFINKLIISSINMTQLPMLVKPRVIENDNKYSPYLCPEIYHVYNPLDTMIKPKYDQREVSESSPTLRNCINYLNSIELKINKDALNFILNEWFKEDSKLFKGLNLERMINKNESKELKKEKMSHNSKHFLLYNILRIAYLYRNHNFYLPMFCDFRGRLYTHNSILSYQGHDLSRSLLLFAENQKIDEDGIKALIVYFANLAGFDKESWSTREEKGLEFFKNNYEKFNTNFDKFLEENDQLKEPFQLISMFKAMEKLIRFKDYNISNPILFDASCSGIQHLSAMTKEIDMAIQVNVINLNPNPELEKPNDFYIYALEQVRKALKASDIKVLNKIILNRKIIKRSVMTIPYNISLTGIGEQLSDHFKSIKDEKGKYVGYLVPAEAVLDNESLILTPSEFGNLTKIIYKVLTKEMPSLKLLGEYLDSLTNILTNFDLPVIWITPAGMKIKLNPVKMEEVKAKINLLGRGRDKITISLPTLKLNKRKAQSSLMPNLIHSLDASNIHLLVKYLLETNNNMPLYTIHDCFASTPNNILKLEKIIKLTFLKIYFENNYLEEMHKNIIAQIKSFLNKEIIEKDGKKYFITNDKIKILIPEIPKSFTDNSNNELFIDGLLNSKYFIS